MTSFPHSATTNNCIIYSYNRECIAALPVVITGGYKEKGKALKPAALRRGSLGDDEVVLSGAALREKYDFRKYQ